MTITFQKATKEKAKLRVALDGPAKSGKTYTALILAEAVTKRFGGRIALIDTERGSASKYADRFDFDVAELPDFHPDQFIKAIQTVTGNGDYGVLVIDSLSHEWMGQRGVLQLVEAEQAKPRANKFVAWRVPSALHTKLVDAMLQSNVHLIATMRSKMKHVQESDERGKTVIRKVGLEPVQRDGMQYEFDVLISIDIEHTAAVTGSRCPDMDGHTENRPDGTFFTPLLDWVSEGAEPKPAPGAKQPKKKEPEPKPQDDGQVPRHMGEFYAMAESVHGISKKDAVDILTVGLSEEVGPNTTVKDALDEDWTVEQLWNVLITYAP